MSSAHSLRIALLEDDAQLGQLMALWLEQAGYECQTFTTGQAFIKAMGRESFDLLIVDWMLPDINGDQVVQWVREHMDWPIPILFVTRRDSEDDIVRALELGADDYMSKPVGQKEMMARISALIRRANPVRDARGVLEVPPFVIDANRRAVLLNGEPLELTQKEFDLTLFLFRHAGRVLSRGHILESVWGRSPDLNTRTVDTHISRLRYKLHLTAETGWRLSAIYQHGYRLEPIEAREQVAAD